MFLKASCFLWQLVEVLHNPINNSKNWKEVENSISAETFADFHWHQDIDCVTSKAYYCFDLETNLQTLLTTFEKIQKNNFKANRMSVPSKQKHTWQGWVWSQTNLWVSLVQQWQKVAEWMAMNLLDIAPSLTSSALDVDDYTVICSLSPANYYTKLYVLRILLHL